MAREPELDVPLAERRAAAVAARQRMLERFKPKPAAPAPPEAFLDAELKRQRFAEQCRIAREMRQAERHARREAREAEEARRAAARASQQASIQIIREAYQAHIAEAAGTIRYAKPGARRPTSATVKAALHDLQGGRCYLCRDPLGDDVTVDHVMPRARFGVHDGNRLLAHERCNFLKDDRAPTEAELAYLTEVNRGLAKLNLL